MDASVELKQLLADMDQQGVKIVRKDQSTFFKILGWLVYAFTFGKNSSFTTGYITTINKTIGVPSTWDSFGDLAKLEILTHEMVHVAQAKKWTFILFGFLYLFIFLPLGLAYFRYVFEREAYVVGFKKLMQYDPSPETRARCIDHGVTNMTTGQYGWAWPFPKSVRAWFESQL